MSDRRRWGVAWAVAAVLAGAAIYAFVLDPGWWTAAGDRRLRAGELVRAERAYQRALRIDGDHAPALYGLGWSYLRAGLLEEAEQRFLRAVAVDGTYAGGYRGLAAVAAARGQAGEAERHLRTAHDLAPGDPGVLTDLAGLYIDAGHAEQGLELHERAVAAAPRRAEYRLALAESYLALGRTGDARSTVEAAAEASIRDDHFRGATEDLLVRAALIDVEALLSSPPLGAAPCRDAGALLEEADGALQRGVSAGLDGDVSRRDRRWLEDLRARVARQCDPLET